MTDNRSLIHRSNSTDALAGGREPTALSHEDHLLYRRDKRNASGTHAAGGASPLPVPVSFQGDEMSMYKQNGQWRGNQPGSTSQYFNCLLGDILESRRGWSQTKLARLLNVSTTSVNSWVRGTAMPPDDTQEMIAHVLGYENRAEIWIYKNGTKILPLVLRMNKLTVELDETESRIRNELTNGHHATIDTGSIKKYTKNMHRKTTM